MIPYSKACGHCGTPVITSPATSPATGSVLCWSCERRQQLANTTDPEDPAAASAPRSAQPSPGRPGGPTQRTPGAHGAAEPLPGRILADADPSGDPWPAGLVDVVAQVLTQEWLWPTPGSEARAILRALDRSGSLVAIELAHEWGEKVLRNISERKTAQREAVAYRARLAQAMEGIGERNDIIRQQVQEIENLRARLAGKDQ
jgi:hypothetical protein